MNKEFKIILKNDLSTSEEELVKTYWDFCENLQDFYYLPKQLTNENLSKSIDVTKFVKANSYILCENLKCIDCKENFYFNTRQSYIDFIKKDTQYCSKCFDNIVALKADEIIFKLRSIIYNKNTLKINKINNLTYMEKVFLYYIFLKSDVSNIDIPINIKNIFPDLDSNIINDIYSVYIDRLINNKILYYIDCQEVTKCWNSFSPYWGAVQERLTLDKIREIAQLSNYRYSSLLLFNEFEIAYDSSDYVEILRDSIYSHVLNENDFRDIENFVINYKLKQVDVFVLEIPDNFEIAINMKLFLRLESILLSMIRETTLPKIYFSLFWAMDNLNSFLYKKINSLSYLTKSKKSTLYINNLEYFLNKYRGRYDEIYDKKIPVDIIFEDDFIDFISYNFIKDSWNGINGNAVISKWIESIEK